MQKRIYCKYLTELDIKKAEKKQAELYEKYNKVRKKLVTGNLIEFTCE